MVAAGAGRACLGEGDTFRPKPVGAGPWVEATSGAVWPQPQDVTTGPDVLQIDPNDFDFEVRRAHIVTVVVGDYNHSLNFVLGILQRCSSACSAYSTILQLLRQNRTEKNN